MKPGKDAAKKPHLGKGQSWETFDRQMGPWLSTNGGAGVAGAPSTTQITIALAAIKIHNSQSLHHDPPPQIAYNTKRIGLLARRTVEPLLQRATVCCCYRKRVSGKYTLVLTNASGKFA